MTPFWSTGSKEVEEGAIYISVPGGVSTGRCMLEHEVTCSMACDREGDGRPNRTAR